MVTIDNINYLTLKESAKLLGVTRVTIHRWVESGKLKTVKISPRKIFLKENDLKEIFK